MYLEIDVQKMYKRKEHSSDPRYCMIKLFRINESTIPRCFSFKLNFGFVSNLVEDKKKRNFNSTTFNSVVSNGSLAIYK